MLVQVRNVHRQAMKRDHPNKIIVGDLNTDFEKTSLNREVFQSLLLEHRGQRL